jgi:hypothetical protein
MKAITYENGQLVMIGDTVEVASFLGGKKRGTVIYVYDPKEPSGPNGQNDFGISIRFDNGKELWGIPDKKTKLLFRKNGRT